MNAIRLLLLAASLPAVSLLAGAHPVLAEAPARGAVGATPLGSPGDWIGSGDYPAIALRLNMAGITAFKLTVDATGAPSRCDVTTSSGFDALDRATCQRVMEHARFSPSRDRAGNPVGGTYSTRVRWVKPTGPRPAISERFASMSLSIDPAGKVTACRIVLHVPDEAVAPSTEDPCQQARNSRPGAFGLIVRGDFQGPSATVEVQYADVFTSTLLARVMSAMPGYEQRGLNVHQFTVTHDGKVDQCRYEEQRGDDLLAEDYCASVGRESFDPPFSAFDKDGVASGWHITRVLLKTGQ